MPSQKTDTDPGLLAFCRGVELAGDEVAPGFGAFIEQCVREVMAQHGKTYTPVAQVKTRRRKAKEE